MESADSRYSAFEDSKHVSSILNILQSQRPFAKLCDVILKVSGEIIFAHSNVLCAASPYFDALFCGGQDLPRAFSQKTPQIIEIHIDGDEKNGYIDAVQKVVDFMYTSVIEISDDSLSPIIEIAKIMQMETILEFCTQFQLGSHGNIPHYVLHKENSDFLFRKVGTRDMMVQTDDMDEYKKELSLNDSNISRNVKKSKHSTGNKDSLQVNGLKGSDNDSIKNLGNENEISSVPIKRKRGRPRKDVANIIKIEKGNATVEVEEKPQVIQIKAPPVTPSVQTLRVSARVRDRILMGKYKDFTEMKETERHENEHTGKQKDDVTNQNEENPRVVYQCNMCSHVSASLESFNRHRNIHEGNNKHVCDKCDFSTSKTKEFDQHKREHLHAENKCSFCGWVCNNSEINSTEFQEHLAKHVGPEPYFCTVCDLRFKTKTKLQLHTPKHSAVKPFVCDQCGAGFKWKHSLKNHMIVHKNTKDYLCDFCGFSTAHKSQMTSHRLIHTGETFKCTEPDCTFIATKRNYLQYHMLTHTHEKPHQCEVCGQSFSLIKNMKRHMLLHSNARSFKCEKCTFSTTRFDKLKEHYWKQHNIGAPPGKKFRLKDYLEVKQPAEVEADVAAADIESAEVPNEEMQTIELQIDETGIIDETATSSITYLETSTGEPFPVAITEVAGETQLAEVQYPDLDTSNFQTVYVTHVEVASDQ